MAVAGAATKARQLGYECLTETIVNEGAAEVVAQRLVRQLQRLNVTDSHALGACLISGGEPTVELPKGQTLGGRNQHLVLAAILQSLELDSNLKEEFSFLSAGTDGEDGNTTVAGAVFDSELLYRLQLENWRKRIIEALESRNSFALLEELRCNFRVPQTRTNVGDLRVILRRPGRPRFSIKAS